MGAAEVGWPNSMEGAAPVVEREEPEGAAACVGPNEKEVTAPPVVAGAEVEGAPNARPLDCGADDAVEECAAPNIEGAAVEVVV